MSAVIYARFSTDKQDVQSIDDQVRICTEWAQREQLAVGKVYSDQGISGAAMGNRPSFLAMMRAAQGREFTTLLVMDLSRLSRSTADLAKTIDRLTFGQVRVVGVQDGFDTQRDGHELVSGLSGIIGQQFRKMISRKTHAALQSRAMTKRSAGGKAYGYRPMVRPDGTKSVEVVASEARVIREIFDAYGSGKAMKSIAGDLNARAVPSPGADWRRTVRRADGKWLQSTIHGILRNETFIGRQVWNRTAWTKDPDTGKRRCVERPRSEWVQHDAPELRILSDQAWQLVQYRITGREVRLAALGTGRPSRRGGQPKYLLSGLLVCSVCGSKYTVTYTNHGQRYVCGSHTNGGHHACSNALHVTRALVEKVVLGETVEQLLSPAAIALATKEMQRLYRERQAAPKALSKQDGAKSAQLDRQIAELERLVREGVLGKDVAAAAVQKATTEREALQTASAAGGGKSQATVARLLPKAADGYRRMVENLDSVLTDERRIRQARAALRELLGDQVILSPAATGDHLVAELAMHREPLLRAAGSDGLWNGSGGRI